MKDAVYLPFRDGATIFTSTYDLGRTSAHVVSDPAPHNGKVYILSGPQLASGDDIAKAFSNVLGKEVKYINVPPSETKKAFLGFGLPEWQVDGILELFEEYAQKKNHVTDHIKQITGVAPRSIEETARAAFGANH